MGGTFRASHTLTRAHDARTNHRAAYLVRVCVILRRRLPVHSRDIYRVAVLRCLKREAPYTNGVRE